MALVQFLSMYGFHNIEIKSKIALVYSDDFENKAELKETLEDIREEYNKIFEDVEINSLLPALFLEDIEKVKSFCVDYCMQDIIMITKDHGKKLKKQMEDYIKAKMEEHEEVNSIIYGSKESFDEWIETLGNFVYDSDNPEPINPEDNLITDDIVQRYIDETILKYRIIFGSKLVAGCSSESEAIDILKDTCGIEKDFALFLYRQGALTQSNAAYATQLYRSFITDGKGTFALQNLVNTMSKVAANLSIYSEKASIKSIIEKFVTDCNSGSDAKQAYATYVSYMKNNEEIDYSNAVQEFKNGKISSEELKAILSYIKLNEDDVDAILSKLWLEGNKEYEVSDKNDDNIQNAANIDIHIQIATIFCGSSHAVNSFIDSQNKLIQLLIAMEDVSSYTKPEEPAEGNEGEDNSTGNTDYGKLLSIYDRASSVNSLDEFNKLTEDESLLLSDISTSQTSGNNMLSSYSNISFHEFSAGQLVSMIEKMISAKQELEKSDTSELKNDEIRLNNEIAEKEEEIIGKEEEIGASKGEYNTKVGNVNSLVSAADKAYLDYLKAKEVYFFCVNIYADGKDMSRAIDMYRSQMAEYTQKYNEQVAIYDIALQVFQDDNAQKSDI
ncbi:MAG: hypothetical protein GX435_08215, partial [Exilispira sp.]|nr:hypothetical protein [Exilispira sp.]